MIDDTFNLKKLLKINDKFLVIRNSEVFHFNVENSNKEIVLVDNIENEEEELLEFNNILKRNFYYYFTNGENSEKSIIYHPQIESFDNFRSVNGLEKYKLVIGDMAHIFVEENMIYILLQKDNFFIPFKYLKINEKERELFLKFYDEYFSSNYKKRPFNNIFGDDRILNVMFKCEELLKEDENIYISFDKKFPNGKIRTLHGPNPKFKNLLVDLNAILQRKYDKINRDIQTAYKKKISIVNNASPHKDNKYLFKADITDFFPSCKRELVKPIVEYLFKGLSCSDKLLNKFLDYMLVDDGLCLGNPISATIANAVIAKPAEYMNNMCKKTGCVFTQYSDDITISSNKPIAKQFMIDLYDTAYKHYDLDGYFKIKHFKLRGQVGNARNITGLAFDHTDNNNVTIRRWMYKEIRVKIHKLFHKQIEADEAFYAKLKGQMQFMIMVGKGDRLLNYIDKFPNILKDYNLLSKSSLYKCKLQRDFKEYLNLDFVLEFIEKGKKKKNFNHTLYCRFRKLKELNLLEELNKNKFLSIKEESLTIDNIDNISTGPVDNVERTDYDEMYDDLLDEVFN